MAIGRICRSAPLARWLLLLSIPGLLVCRAPGGEPEAAAPQRYVLNYPQAEQFCPPVETYFDDVTQAIQKVGGKTIRHQLNGGYGLAVVDKIGDQHVLHLGSDVAWNQPGVPIHAIAGGVVRLSQGVPTAAELKNKEPGKASPNQNAALAWGNLIVVEHRLPGDRYVTSVYGHLSNRRLVAAGDIVQAGQVIGFEGHKGVENGGYPPHLHLGIREGRMFERGMELVSFKLNDKPVKIKLANLSENELELQADAPELTDFTLHVLGRDVRITSHDGKLWAPSTLLNAMPAPADFAVGYGLTTEGWLDPTDFLRLVGADVRPAPYLAISKTTAAKPKQ